MNTTRQAHSVWPYARLAQDGFKPAKYFSIDRVFRNEVGGSWRTITRPISEHDLPLG
jgi:hypothetical protein